MTQTRLTEIIGIPRVSITRYENKKHDTGIEKAMELAKALDVTLDELTGKKQDAV